MPAALKFDFVLKYFKRYDFHTVLKNKCFVFEIQVTVRRDKFL